MRRRAIGATLACTTLALFAACGGDSSSTTSPTGSNPNNSPSDTATISATLVDSVATAFDAQVGAGDSLYTSISHILGGLIPTLVEGQEAAVDTTVANGDPFVTEQQFSDLAAAYQNNVSFGVGNFISAAATTGITTSAGAPIDSTNLTQALATLVGKSRYAQGDILPATVIAIGQARAKRDGVASDPVWGDGRLDPLQATLLMYALDFSTGDSTSSSGMLATTAARPAFDEVPAVPWGRAVKGAMTGLLSKIFHFPFGKLEATKATICASVILYSYKFGLQQSERDLWHQDPAATNHPYQSQLTAYLVFDFKPYNQLSAKVLSDIGCQLPPVGAAPNKNVSWHLDDTLTKHGGFTIQDLVTDNNGYARATYQTIKEVVPHVLQTGIAQNATGTWDISAHGLLPDKWSGLEKSVGVGVYVPSDTGLRLFVNYYNPPSKIELKTHIQEDGTGTGTPYNFSGAGDIDLMMTDIAYPIIGYYGIGTGSYENWSYTPQQPPGCVSVSGTSNGNLLAELIPDSTSVGNVLMTVGLTAGYPVEHYVNPCNGNIDYPRLWSTWLNQDVRNMVNFSVISSGHLQKVFDETFSNLEANVTEHVTMDLYVTP